MIYHRIFMLAVLMVVLGLVTIAACNTAYVDFSDCTRQEVIEGGCAYCPVTCHDYDNEDAGDDAGRDADAAPDADAAD